MSCGCKQNDCGCEQSCPDICPIKLDFKCVLYNKDSTEVSTLDGLNLPNGTSLKAIIEIIDDKFLDLKVQDYNLPFLRNNHVINNFKQLNETIDTVLSNIETSISNIPYNMPLTTINSSSINFSTSGALNHTLTGNVKISIANDLLTVVSDGLFVEPQTLSLNYNTKVLSLSYANSVDLSGIINQSSGYLGEVTSDPNSAINGNYWFNTVQNKLKIKVNNIIKEIITN